MSNYLTEAEAMQRWCPFVRTGVYAGNGAISVNRHVDKDIQAECHCEASGCMAWRFDGEQSHRRYVMCPNRYAEDEDDAGQRPPQARPGWEFVGCNPKEFLRDGEVTGLAHWIEPEEEWHKRRVGYCGLAGAPIFHRTLAHET